MVTERIKDKKLQNNVIIAIGDHQSCWEDDTVIPFDIAHYLDIEQELVKEVQWAIGEEYFRCIGDICALSPSGWEHYLEIKQEVILEELKEDRKSQDEILKFLYELYVDEYQNTNSIMEPDCLMDIECSVEEVTAVVKLNKHLFEITEDYYFHFNSEGERYCEKMLDDPKQNLFR